MESSRTSTIDNALIRQVFERVHEGFSADRMIADPELNSAFLRECAALHLEFPARRLNRALMNLRKSGTLDVETTHRTSFDDEYYRFASEIAIRLLERRDGTTLDEIICDPSRAAEFDEIAASISPGFTPLNYRWAALSLRKQRELRPEVATSVIRPKDVKLIKLDDLIPDDVPNQPGVYRFIDSESNKTLYVGETSKLRRRLSQHTKHSDNKDLAMHLWQRGRSSILIEYSVFPEGTSKRKLRAIELEQIRSTRAVFNVVGSP